MTDLAYMSATELTKRLCERDISSLELTDCYIDRIERNNSDLLASRHLTAPFVERTHSEIPNSSHLVRLLCPIILLLLSTVDRLGYQLPMRNAIATQLVGHDLPGPLTM